MIYFFGTEVCYANHDIQNAEYDKGNKCQLCFRIVMQAYDFVAREMPIVSWNHVMQAYDLVARAISSCLCPIFQGIIFILE